MAPAGLSFTPGSDWSQPWFAALHPVIDQIGPLAEAGDWPRCLVLLNRFARELQLHNEAGKPLSFIDSAGLPELTYEQHIWQTGQVPTRLAGDGAWHDLFNALTWLAFGNSKARLNALQAAQIADAGIGAQRGGLRDAATLFDENAALFVTANPAFAQALRAFDWRELFVTRRAQFLQQVQVVAFGHALVDKLRNPFKSICAHAWVLQVPACRFDELTFAMLDQLLAGSLQADALRSRAFSPLPVLGLPGWWTENEDPAFYNDVSVFRPGRRKSAATTSQL